MSLRQRLAGFPPPSEAVGNWLIDPRPRHQSAKFYRLDSASHYQLVGPDVQGIIRSTVITDFWWQMSWLWEDPEPDPSLLLETITGRALER